MSFQFAVPQCGWKGSVGVSVWWFGCRRVAEQELIENRLPIVYPDAIVGSGWWLWGPKVAEQELIENRLPIA